MAEAAFVPNEKSNSCSDDLNLTANIPNPDNTNWNKSPTIEGRQKSTKKLPDGDVAISPVYPGGIELILITTALALATFLAGLDANIIATAIPTITDHFNALDDVGWYGSAYLLTTCSTQLFYGRLYKFFFVKWVFVSAVGILFLGSLISGIAPTSTALIVGRAIAGSGCAGIISGSLIIIAHTVPLRQRSIYMGFIGAMEGVAIVIAPLLSGAITQHVNWRWCFYLTLPIGGVTILAIAIFFKPPRTHEASSLTFMGKVKEMDLFGMFMLIPSIVCLLLALQWGGTRFAWNSSRIIALLVIFALSFIAFVAIQIWKKDGASLPPRVIKQRGVALGLVYSLCTASALAVMDFYLPIWFQVIKGFSPTQSGVGVLPIIIGLILGSILTGSAVAAIGYYTPAMIGGSVLMSIGSGLITTFTPNTGYSKWIGYQAVIGLGGGMSFQQPMLAVQTILQEKDVPIGTTAVVWANNLGATIFVSIAQNVFSNQLKAGLVKSVPNVDPSIVLSTGATSLKNSIDPTYLRVVITQYNGALIHVFYIALGLTCFGMLLALGMEWKSVKGDGEKNKGSEAEAVKQNQEVGQVDQEKTSLA